MGHNFKKELAKSLEKNIKDKNWGKRIDSSKKYLPPTQQYFPRLVEELKGYAKGTDADFHEIWALSIEGDELTDDKCTTVVTNKGNLLSYNEDWTATAKDAISLVKKTLGKLTIFEIYYHNTLGGCSVSINSNGFAQAINTLEHKGGSIGVPRNIIARWLSETSNPESDFTRLKTIPRQLGYNHLFLSTKKEIWDIETTNSKAVISKPNSPYVHTNHYLSEELKPYENNNNETGTFDRCETAKSLVRSQMTEEELIGVMSNTTQEERSVFNERTIGRTVINIEKRNAKVWLLRENNLGWIDYSLDFLP